MVLSHQDLVVVSQDSVIVITQALLSSPYETGPSTGQIRQDILIEPISTQIADTYSSWVRIRFHTELSLSLYSDLWGQQRVTQPTEELECGQSFPLGDRWRCLFLWPPSPHGWGGDFRSSYANVQERTLSGSRISTSPLPAPCPGSHMLRPASPAYP